MPQQNLRKMTVSSKKRIITPVRRYYFFDMKIKNILTLVVCIVVSELAGIIGSLFTASSVGTWYTTLTKPSFNPPSWVFGPVWTTLFLLMGVALYLVLTKRAGFLFFSHKKIGLAVGVFGVQLVLNILWSILFFGLHNPGAALVEIVFLWFAIFGTIIAFYKISKPAAYLLVPYIAWVSFAAILNFMLWKLN